MSTSPIRIEAVETDASTRGEFIAYLVFFAICAALFVFGLIRGREWGGLLILGFLAAFALYALFQVAGSRRSLSRHGEAYLELAAPALPGGRLEGRARFSKGVGRLPRLVAALDCWLCDYRGSKIEQLWSAQQVVDVARVGTAAEAGFRFELPAEARSSRTPPFLAIEGEPSFSGVPVRKSERFIVWELSVSSGMRDPDIARRFRVPVGEEESSAAFGSGPGAVASPAPRLLPGPVLALVAANLLPVAGVIYLDWKVRDIILLYWIENLVIGAYNVLNILTLDARQFEPLLEAARGRGGTVLTSRLGLALFFTIHYGGFCAIHGMFLGFLFAPGHGFYGFFEPLREILGELLRDPGILGVLLALVVSHGISVLRHHFAQGERHSLELGTLMMRPYGRVVVTHGFVLLGAMLLTGTREPMAALLLFIGLKTLLDFGSHWWAHSGARRR